MTEVFCLCGKRFLAKPELVGRWAQCPACKQRFILAPAVAPEELVEIEPQRPQKPQSADRWSPLPLIVADIVLIGLFVILYMSRFIPERHAAIVVIAPPVKEVKPPTRAGPFSPFASTLFRPHPNHHFTLEIPQNVVRDILDREPGDFKEAMVAENERLRQEWLATGQPEKQGDLVYLQDRIAEIMRLEQSEVLADARTGNPKPDPRSRLGKSLARYTDKQSEFYNEVFVGLLRRIAPGWLVN